LPAAISPNSHHVVRWIHLGSEELSDPFFVHTVKRLRRGTPPAPQVETSLDMLTGLDLPPVSPAGIIFHVSRCGSTLVLNTLKTAERVVGVSEPQPITLALELSRSESAAGRRRAAEVLRSIVSLYAHYQGGEAGQVVVKCHVPNIRALPWIRTIWPDVPCLVLIRDPLEVVVSNVLLPAKWLLAWGPDRPDSPHVFGCVPDEIAERDSAAFCAWCIGRFFEIADSVLDDRTAVLDYEDLGSGTLTAVMDWFGLSRSPGSEANFQQSLLRNAKRPGDVYEDDRAKKRAAVTARIRESVERWTAGHYLRIRERRAMWLANQGRNA
jgi:hypothetical protein